MAIHVVILPIIGTGKGHDDAFRPDFGSIDMEKKGRRWGQASSKFAKEGTVAVWVECDEADADTLKADPSAVYVAEAVKDADVATTNGKQFTDAYREKIAAAEAALVEGQK